MVMVNPFIVRDWPLFAGHWIFVEDSGRLADKELLTLFGYSDEMTRIERSELVDMDQRQSFQRLGGIRHFVVIAGSARWKVIADDALYTLWHRDSTRQVVCSLAEEYDVLTFSEGDTDSSHSIRKFTNGQLVRELIYDDPNWPDGQGLVADFGSPLDGESGVQRKHLREYLLGVAAADGFDIADVIDTARMWIGEPFDHKRSRVDSALGEKARRTNSWRK